MKTYNLKSIFHLWINYCPQDQQRNFGPNTFAKLCAENALITLYGDKYVINDPDILDKARSLILAKPWTFQDHFNMLFRPSKW